MTEIAEPEVEVPADGREMVVASVLPTPDGVELTPSNLRVTDASMTYERVEEIIGVMRNARDATTWWIGDLLRFAESRYGEKYAQAMDATGLSYQRLANVVSTCERVSPDRRRDDLSFAHHEAVASLEAAVQVEWLTAAAEKQWSLSQLRDALRDAGMTAKREPRSPAEAAAAASSQEATETVDAARHLSVVGEALTLVESALAGGDDPQKTVSDLEAILPKAQEALAAAARPVIAAAATASLTTAARDVVKSATVSGGFAMVPIAVFETFRGAVAGE